MTNLFALSLIIIAFIVLWLLTRWLARENKVALRPLPNYNLIKQQAEQALEHGAQVHLSLGRGSLITQKTATSVAALQILRFLAEKGRGSGLPPHVIVGAGTLLPAAEDGMRHQMAGAAHTGVYFVADTNQPYAFGIGVANEVEQQKTTSYIAAGYQGTELALASLAAQHHGTHQLTATDDPAGMAVATAVSNEQLIGEDVFAAGAYLTPEPVHRASLLLQDLGRWVIALIILLTTLVQLLT